LSISPKNVIQNREAILNNLNSLANDANTSNVQGDVQKKEKRAGGRLFNLLIKIIKLKLYIYIYFF